MNNALFLCVSTEPFRNTEATERYSTALGPALNRLVFLWHLNQSLCPAQWSPRLEWVTKWTRVKWGSKGGTAVFEVVFISSVVIKGCCESRTRQIKTPHSRLHHSPSSSSVSDKPRRTKRALMIDSVWASVDYRVHPNFSDFGQYTMFLWNIKIM